MAEEQDRSEQTEEPTQKRLDDAHKRGEVPKSQEVNAWFVLGAATVVLMTFGGPASSALSGTLRGFLANAHMLPIDGGGAHRVAGRIGFEVLAALGIPLLALMVAAAMANLIQHRLVWSAEPITPKASKVSPLAGMKRLFSKQALINFVKGIVKLVLIGTVMVMVLWPNRFRLEGLVQTDVAAVMPLTRGLTLEMLGTVVAVLAVVAALDYLFQYRQWYERLKMTPRQLKEEYKETEGDPKIKARIRQIRQTRMRKRMMAAVPQATVVITNPTHFAVALKYERGMNAPLCVAKGRDTLALRIRAVAEEHGVPVVENPPLARTLHATVEVDQEVPPEHYRAVAEVIGYVLGLKRAVAR